jgi:hypothetical protein
VLIGFSNGIRGAKRLTALKALGDTDNDMPSHARKYGTGSTRFQLQSERPLGVTAVAITLLATIARSNGHPILVRHEPAAFAAAHN